jgi:hypothetical protein
VLENWMVWPKIARWATQWSPAASTARSDVLMAAMPRQKSSASSRLELRELSSASRTVRVPMRV